MKQLLIALFFLFPQINVRAADCPDLPDVTRVSVYHDGESYTARLNNILALEQFAAWSYTDAWSESWYTDAPFDLDPDYNIVISTDNDNRPEWVGQVYMSKSDAWVGYPAFYDWNPDAPVSSDGVKHPSCWLAMDIRQLWEFIELVKNGAA